MVFINFFGITVALMGKLNNSQLVNYTILLNSSIGFYCRRQVNVILKFCLANNEKVIEQIIFNSLTFRLNCSC